MRRMMTWMLAAGLSAGALAANEEKLSDDEGLEQWTFFLQDPSKKKEDVWKVKDGVIHCVGKPAGYIKTLKPYENYVLTLEWRWPAGKKPGNSGVLLHTNGPDKIWPKSIEAQLHSGDAGDFWVIDGAEITVEDAAKRTQGRRTLNLTNGSEKPIGQWNKYEIECKGDSIKLLVNGDLVNQATKSSLTKGHICLQSEGAPIEFRNIVIRPIE